MVKRFVMFLLCLIVIIALILILAYVFFSYRIPNGGELIDQVTSPNGEYTVEAYLMHNSLSADAIRCDVVMNESESNYKRTIYWNYPCDYADIIWGYDDSVIINGMEINVKNGRYDFRHVP